LLLQEIRKAAGRFQKHQAIPPTPSTAESDTDSLIPDTSNQRIPPSNEATTQALGGFGPFGRFGQFCLFRDRS